MAYEIRDRNSKATNQSPLPPSSHIETPAAAAMSNAKRSSFKFHDLLRRCAAFLTSSSAGCVRAGRIRDSWLPDDFDRADFLCMQELRQSHLAPIPPCSFFAFHCPQMILLKSVHCLAVGIVALRDDANPSSWLFAFYPETLLRKWKPLKQASEMARSPSEVTEQCDIFCNLFRFFFRSLSRRSTTCVGGWTRCRRSTT